MRSVAIVLLAFFVAACDPAAFLGPPPASANANVAPPGIASLRTDHGTYLFRAGEFGPELAISARFQAPDDTSVDLANCNGSFTWRLQKLEASGWAEAWIPAMDACLSAPIAIPRSGAFSGSHLVRRGAGSALQPGTDGRELSDGTYRLVWEGVTSSSGFDLDLPQRTSNEFVIRH